jgi:hypothetical protein
MIPPHVVEAMKRGRCSMAGPDQVPENPTSGQRIVFRKTAGHTGCKLLGYRVRYPGYNEYSRLDRVG